MPPDDVTQALRIRLAGQPGAAAQAGKATAQTKDSSGKIKQRGVGVFPVQPGDWVILAVGVVVARLRPPQFVPALKHRHALCESQRRQHRALQTDTLAQDDRIVTFAFFAAVAGKVVTVSVAVILAVEFVVLVAVAHEIAQGEAVVRGNEVQAGLRGSAFPVEKFA